MDNSNDPKSARLFLTPAQKDLRDALEIRYDLNFPKSLKNNYKWSMDFLRLCAFDTNLEKNHFDQRGWRVIDTIKKDYYWTDYLDNTAKKLGISEKDVNFILSMLKSYSIEPLIRAPNGLIDDPEKEAFALEEERAYAEPYFL